MILLPLIGNIALSSALTPFFIHIDIAFQATSTCGGNTSSYFAQVEYQGEQTHNIRNSTIAWKLESE